MAISGLAWRCINERSVSRREHHAVVHPPSMALDKVTERDGCAPDAGRDWRDGAAQAGITTLAALFLPSGHPIGWDVHAYPGR